MMVIDTVKMKLDGMVNLNMIDMVISYSIFTWMIRQIHIMVKQFLCTIEMNGLCKLNQVVNHEIMKLKMGCIKWNGLYQKY